MDFLKYFIRFHGLFIKIGSGSNADGLRSLPIMAVIQNIWSYTNNLSINAFVPPVYMGAIWWGTRCVPLSQVRGI